MIDLPVHSDHPEPEARKSTRYNFDRFHKGTSTHVKTDQERRNILIAYRYWCNNIKKCGNARYATSRKVDDSDSSGPGYRIWFLSRGDEPGADEI